MLASILRTVIPALWGSFIVWLLGLVPVLEPLREDLLAYADLAVPIIAGVIIGLWYALWRWLEPKLPDWLTRILLGSAHTPVYDPYARVNRDPEYADRAPIPGTTLDLGATEADPERYEQ